MASSSTVFRSRPYLYAVLRETRPIYESEPGPEWQFTPNYTKELVSIYFNLEEANSWVGYHAFELSGGYDGYNSNDDEREGPPQWQDDDDFKSNWEVTKDRWGCETWSNKDSEPVKMEESKTYVISVERRLMAGSMPEQLAPPAAPAPGAVNSNSNNKKRRIDAPVVVISDSDDA